DPTLDQKRRQREVRVRIPRGDRDQDVEGRASGRGGGGLLVGAPGPLRPFVPRFVTRPLGITARTAGAPVTVGRPGTAAVGAAACPVLAGAAALRTAVIAGTV